MKKIIIILFCAILSLISFTQQSGDIMYFAQRADGKKEYGLSDRFTTGALSVICKLVTPVSKKEVIVQLDKRNSQTGEYSYYQSYERNIDPTKKYLYFNNIVFDSPGIYRVFLLDDNSNTITSALIEIIEPIYYQRQMKK